MGVTVLRRRYLSLGLGELTAAAVFIVGYFVLRPRLGGSVGVPVAVAVLVVLLVQGAGYWLLARAWVPKRMPPSIVGGFRLLRVINVVLLASTAVVVAGDLARAGALAVGVWLFAVVEYLNYFWVRLSYPVPQWWAGVRSRRPSALARDLGRA